MLRFIFFQVFFPPPVFKDAEGRQGSAVFTGKASGSGAQARGWGERGAGAAPSEMTGSAQRGTGGTLPHYIFIVQAAEGPIKAA